MLLGYEGGPKDRTVAVIGPGRPIESQRLVPFVLFAYETENVRVILQRCTCFSYDGIPIRASPICFEEMERGASRWHETETPPMSLSGKSLAVPVVPMSRRALQARTRYLLMAD